MKSNRLFFRKNMIALTGLFLCLFLIVHLSANCLLLLPQDTARGLYNAYSTFLRENPLIMVVAYALYASILIHVLYAVLVLIRNRKAKPVKYAVNLHRENSSWASQNMGVLGALILIFILVHLVNFWARIKLGIGAEVAYDEAGNKDIYEVTYSLFQNIYYVAFYALLAIPLGLHLHHGLQAAFKTLGFYHQPGLDWLARVSLIYAILISAGFGIIPIVVYFQ